MMRHRWRIVTSSTATRPMRIPAARFSDNSLTMMISDLCAQHPKLTGIRKEQNAVYLKELAAEKFRRAA